VPEGEFAVARMHVTLSNDVMVESDNTPWANIRKGLSFSLMAGSWALMLVMVGLCFVLPLGLMIWGGRKLYLRFRP
jgi:hypothetical protein